MSFSAILIQDMSTTLATRVAVLLLGFATNVFVARTLGSAGMGEYVLIMTTLGFMVLVGSVGLDSSNVYLAGQQKYSAEELAFNSLWVAFISGFALAILFMAVRHWAFGTVLQNVRPMSIVLGLIAIPMMLTRNFLQAILRGKNWITIWNGTVLANSSLLLVLLIVFLRGLGLGVDGAIAAQIMVAGVISAVLTLLLFWNSRLSWRIQEGALRDGVGYGLKILASNAMNFFNLYLNCYLLNMFLSTSEVGTYAVAVALVQPVLMIPTAIQYVLFPRVSASEISQAARWMSRLLRQSVLLMAGICLGLLLCSAWLVSWFYGPEYAASTLTLQLLIPGSFMASISSVLSGYNCGRGRPDIDIYAAGAALGVTVTLGLWLVPQYGLVGAGLTSSAAFSILAIVQFLAYLRVSGNGVVDSVFVRRDDIFSTYDAVTQIVAKWKGRV
jgi:O-antigen/teichoic acid export membrane protein